mgnify:CR=1 FL=1
MLNSIWGERAYMVNMEIDYRNTSECIYAISSNPNSHDTMMKHPQLVLDW